MKIFTAVHKTAPKLEIHDLGTKYHFLINGRIKHVIPYDTIGKKDGLTAILKILDHYIEIYEDGYKCQYATCVLCADRYKCSWADPSEPFNQDGGCIAVK